MKATKEKKETKQSTFTPAACEEITKAEQTLALFRSDLMQLSAALTTKGTRRAAEGIAHDALLDILDLLAPVETKLKRLAFHVIGR